MAMVVRVTHGSAQSRCFVGIDHYRHKYGPGLRNGDIYFFGPTFVKWQIQYSAAFVDQPFSVTIQGGDGDAELVKKAMAQVNFRTSGEFSP